MRILPFACLALALGGCLDAPTKRIEVVTNPDDGGPDAQTPDGGGGPTPCERDEQCEGALFSRCGSDGKCAPCDESAHCARIPDAKVCIPGTGCFPCSATDTESCPAGQALCSTDNQCVQCTEANTDACAGTSRPLCEASLGTCVECRSPDDCQDPTLSACNDNACAPCANDGDCSHLARANICEPESKKCIECQSDSDCGADTPVCDTASGTCGACTDSAQCARFDDTKVCGSGACVECTAAEREVCQTAQAEPAACNVLENRCDASRGVGQTGACEPCVSDHECIADHFCVETTFDSEPQGRHCMPSTTAGCSTNRPYATIDMDRPTIEGAAVNACVLAYTSCAAVSGEHGYKQSCGVNAMGEPASSGAVRGENDLCGVDGLDDGFCVNTAPGEYRCTLPCFADEDCPDSPAITCETRAHETGSRKLCTF